MQLSVAKMLRFFAFGGFGPDTAGERCSEGSFCCVNKVHGRVDSIWHYGWFGTDCIWKMHELSFCCTIKTWKSDVIITLGEQLNHGFCLHHDSQCWSCFVPPSVLSVVRKWVETRTVQELWLTPQNGWLEYNITPIVTYIQAEFL